MATAPLRLLHDEETIRRRAGYAYWERRSSDEIVDSLDPNGRSPLIVDAHGLVWNGNTRVLILGQHGYDVDSLPRMAKPISGIEEIDDHD